MHRISLIIILLFSATAVDAAWYQKTDGTIVDPIQRRLPVGDHWYSGNNLEPGADLPYADLYYADLINADLSEAWLDNAYMGYADLSEANLRDADLTGADLSGSDFSAVFYYDNSTWTDAFYYTDNEPTWRSGMDAAWRTSVGILALAPTNAVPEPSTLLLALFGLALLPRKRRR